MASAISLAAPLLGIGLVILLGQMRKYAKWSPRSLVSCVFSDLGGLAGHSMDDTGVSSGIEGSGSHGQWRALIILDAFDDPPMLWI